MNVFDIIPSDFFNCLAGKSNNRVYADCLELIHNQYDKEISYRLERSYLRDVLAAFLLENHLDLSDEESTTVRPGDFLLALTPEVSVTIFLMILLEVMIPIMSRLQTMQ